MASMNVNDRQETVGGNAPSTTHNLDSGKGDELVGTVAAIGPNGLPYKKCASKVKNAEIMKLKLENAPDLSDKDRKLLQKSIDTLNDKKLLDFVAEWKEKYRARAAKNEEVSRKKKERKAGRTAVKIQSARVTDAAEVVERRLFHGNKVNTQSASNSLANDPSTSTGRRLQFSKRSRSDDNVKEPPAKSQRSSTSFDLSDMEIVVAVVNENGLNYKTSVDLWKKVESALLHKMIQLAKQAGAVRPLFDGARWIDGHKIVKCGNDVAVKMIGDLIENWPVDDETKLKMIPEADLVKFSPLKAWLWAPCPHIPPVDLIALIGFQNPPMKAETWKILRVGPRKEFGQHFLIQLNKESLPILERCNFVFRLGIVRASLSLVVNPENAEVLPPDGPGANKPSSQ